MASLKFGKDIAVDCPLTGVLITGSLLLAVWVTNASE